MLSSNSKAKYVLTISTDQPLVGVTILISLRRNISTVDYSSLLAWVNTKILRMFQILESSAKLTRNRAASDLFNFNIQLLIWFVSPLLSGRSRWISVEWRGWTSRGWLSFWGVAISAHTQWRRHISDFKKDRDGGNGCKLNGHPLYFSNHFLVSYPFMLQNKIHLAHTYQESLQ